MGNNLYKTKDLYEASVLYCLKEVKFLGLQLGESGQFWFIFESKENCERLAQEYWQRKLKVNAKDFTDAIRNLKDMIFAKK